MFCLTVVALLSVIQVELLLQVNMKRRGSTKTSPPTKIAKLSDDEELSELREADYEGFLVPDIDVQNQTYP
jgi:hypothetical protein